jgi:outer membrane protein OmpA-like peptidoglycan-associated protein
MRTLDHETRRRPAPAGGKYAPPSTRGPTATPPRPALAPGGTPYVQWVQAALNGALGLRLPLTGVEDVATRSAIRSFQQRTGLVVDGIVGPITQAALLQAGAPPLPGTSASSSSAVRGGSAGGATSYARGGGGASGGAAGNPCAGLKPKEVLDRFGFDVAAVPPAHQPRLVSIAGCIIASHRRGRPIKAVKIVGHTDREGTDAYNLQLGQRRAEEVRRQFVETLERMQKGTAARLTITVESRGEKEIVSTKESALNRRVEIHIARPLRPTRPKRPPPTRPVPPELQQLLKKVQEILKLLPPGLGGTKSPTRLRFLDAKEKALARTVYHGSLDFSRILISDGLGWQGRPFTVATQISTGWHVVMNMGDLRSWSGPPLMPRKLIHELAHAWQSQHHTADPQAFMKNSLACQLGAEAKAKVTGNQVSAYYYVPGKAFGDYAAEQIAQQVEHTYTRRGSPTPSVIGVIRSVAPNANSPDNVASLGVMTGWETCGAPNVVC